MTTLPCAVYKVAGGDTMDIPNRLYFGDCLDVMRSDIPSESIDLIYLDPPFNSKRLYNAFIGGAQWVAFDDTWQWYEAVGDFHEVAAQPEYRGTMEGLRMMLGEGPQLAYLSYMANRLMECHRVLKPTGSIYLHCDPTFSHYLKAVMDGIWGERNFRNEITWKRRHGFSSAVHGGVRFGVCTDIILFYGQSERSEFRVQYNRDHPDYEGYVQKHFRLVDENGRQYQATSLTNPSYRPNLIYEYKGYPPREWLDDYRREDEAMG